MESDIAQREGVEYRAIPAAGLHGVGLRALPGNLVKLTRGLLASRRILREFKPHALLFTGGYLAVPMALAASGGSRVPMLLYVPDIEPGLALKTLGYFADRIAATAEETKRFYARPSRVQVTGYPLRAELANWSRDEALRRFNLSADLPTLLITGGSKGARSINMAVLKHLNELLKISQVIHISGNLDWPVIEKARQELSAPLKERYHAMPYLHEMGAAYAAADLVLSRAGASTLGEYPLFGLPAILVPYPHAWRYQKVNADYLVQRGAAALLHDETLDQELFATVKALLENPIKRDAMRSAMKTLSHPDASSAIADCLLEIAGARSL